MTNSVLVLVLLGCVALLFGAPVEAVLSVADNPVSRVVVITFVMSLAGIGVLSFSIHLLLHRHKKLEQELAQMSEQVEAAHARTTALAAAADALENRVDNELERVEETMADERARMRDQVRAYLSRRHVSPAEVDR